MRHGRNYAVKRVEMFTYLPLCILSLGSCLEATMGRGRAFCPGDEAPLCINSAELTFSPLVAQLHLLCRPFVGVSLVPSVHFHPACVSLRQGRWLWTSRTLHRGGIGPLAACDSFRSNRKSSNFIFRHMSRFSTSKGTKGEIVPMKTITKVWGNHLTHAQAHRTRLTPAGNHSNSASASCIRCHGWNGLLDCRFRCFICLTLLNGNTVSSNYI